MTCGFATYIHSSSAAGTLCPGHNWPSRQVPLQVPGGCAACSVQRAASFTWAAQGWRSQLNHPHCHWVGLAAQMPTGSELERMTETRLLYIVSPPDLLFQNLSSKPWLCAPDSTQRERASFFQSSFFSAAHSTDGSLHHQRARLCVNPLVSLPVY